MCVCYPPSPLFDKHWMSNQASKLCSCYTTTLMAGEDLVVDLSCLHPAFPIYFMVNFCLFVAQAPIYHILGHARIRKLEERDSDLFHILSHIIQYTHMYILLIYTILWVKSTSFWLTLAPPARRQFPPPPARTSPRARSWPCRVSSATASPQWPGSRSSPAAG